MKLFIRRNVSSENAEFTVFNEEGYEKYNIILIKKKGYFGFKIMSLNNKVLCKVRRMPINAMNTYSINDFSRRITFMCMPVSGDIRCNFYGVNWHISGNAVSKAFTVMDVDNSVIATHKAVASDYELNVFDSINELLCVAVSVCIDTIATVDNRAAQAV